MREDEANFISYLVCTQSGDRELQYSGVMLAFVHAGNALSSQDRAVYTEVFRTLDEAVQRDIRSQTMRTGRSSKARSTGGKFHQRHLSKGEQPKGRQLKATEG